MYENKGSRKNESIIVNKYTEKKDSWIQRNLFN